MREGHSAHGEMKRLAGEAARCVQQAPVLALVLCWYRPRVWKATVMLQEGYRYGQASSGRAGRGRATLGTPPLTTNLYPHLRLHHAYLATTP